MNKIKRKIIKKEWIVLKKKERKFKTFEEKVLFLINNTFNKEDVIIYNDKENDRLFGIIKEIINKKQYKILLENNVHVILHKEDFVKWIPSINEECVFFDSISKESFNNRFDGFLDVQWEKDFSYKSKDKLKVENYCPCCFQEEPYIEIDRFDYCYPIGICNEDFMKK
jgi:hypothetical protein